jgi:hypothetical protein
MSNTKHTSTRKENIRIENETDKIETTYTQTDTHNGSRGVKLIDIYPCLNDY